MPTPRTRTRQEEPLDLERVRDEVDAWYAVKRQTTMLTKRLNDGKDALKSLVHKYGTTDTDGHIFLNLQGLVGDRKIARLKNQRSVSRSINVEAAERILKRKNLWDEVVDTIQVPNEDKLAAAYFDNRITDAEWDQIMTKSVGYSFYLLDDDNKPVS